MSGSFIVSLIVLLLVVNCVNQAMSSPVLKTCHENFFSNSCEHETSSAAEHRPPDAGNCGGIGVNFVVFSQCFDNHALFPWVHDEELNKVRTKGAIVNEIMFQRLSQ